MKWFVLDLPTEVIVLVSVKWSLARSIVRSSTGQSVHREITDTRRMLADTFPNRLSFAVLNVTRGARTLSKHIIYLLFPCESAEIGCYICRMSSTAGFVNGTAAVFQHKFHFMVWNANRHVVRWLCCVHVVCLAVAMAMSLTNLLKF